MMWPRKQLDIGWADLAFGLLQAVASRAQPPAAEVVGEGWVPANEAIVTLSVRTGWDLLLTSLALPAGSEVVTSAVTIPDMARIIEYHGLTPVPVDVDAAGLEVDLEHLERSITPRTRVILVAHLFGSRMEMGPIIELARRHDLLVVEDCAQAFVGRGYAGHAESDCALFSFGPIKTATALGGAVVRVRDNVLRARMVELQQAYPVQSRLAYVRRLAKYAAFCVLSKPHMYELAVRALKWLGIDYDIALAKASHSFSGSDFFAQIRRRPCAPLVRMLQRRIGTFDARGTARLRRRVTRGDELANSLPDGMVVGDLNASHTNWVVPVRVGNRAAVLAALRAAGFDATLRSSLIVVANPNHSPANELPPAHWLTDIVFMPCGEDVPDHAWQQLIAIVGQTAVPVKAIPARELAALSSVSGVS